MSDYLSQHSVQITAITVGGAVNCLLLRTRETTHDVDIFGTHLDQQARILLDEAMQHARQVSPTPLGTDWFNTETTMWMTSPLQREPTQQAIQQRVVVFEGPGLLLLAAPWQYAMTAKIQWLLSEQRDQIRAYNLPDAAAYLHEIIRNQRGKADICTDN